MTAAEHSPRVPRTAYEAKPNAVDPRYLASLRRQILACPYFTANTLNRDFVATRGFSVVFRREGRARVDAAFPFFKPYIDCATVPDCNAFYLNPLSLGPGSRVDPHIDRSLQSYCARVDPPLVVTVLYVEVPAGMVGGELVLARGPRRLATIVPTRNTLVSFGGHLTHSVNRVDTEGQRLSLVCEQYSLNDVELAAIPEFAIESRALVRDR
jgi:hypothetical protein